MLITELNINAWHGCAKHRAPGEPTRRLSRQWPVNVGPGSFPGQSRDFPHITRAPDPRPEISGANRAARNLPSKLSGSLTCLPPDRRLVLDRASTMRSRPCSVLSLVRDSQSSPSMAGPARGARQRPASLCTSQGHAARAELRPVWNGGGLPAILGCRISLFELAGSCTIVTASSPLARYPLLASLVPRLTDRLGGAMHAAAGRGPASRPHKCSPLTSSRLSTIQRADSKRCAWRSIRPRSSRPPTRVESSPTSTTSSARSRSTPRDELIGQDHRIINSGLSPEGFHRAICGGRSRRAASGAANCEIARRTARSTGSTRPSFRSSTPTVNPVSTSRSAATSLSARKPRHGFASRQALTQLGQLAAVVAHEVRNPLAGLRGSLQILESRLPRGMREREIISPMIQRIDGLSKTVEDILLFARPQPPRLRPLEVRTIISEAIASARRVGAGSL